MSSTGKLTIVNPAQAPSSSGRVVAARCDRNHPWIPVVTGASLADLDVKLALFEWLPRIDEARVRHTGQLQQDPFRRLAVTKPDLAEVTPAVAPSPKRIFGSTLNGRMAPEMRQVIRWTSTTEAPRPSTVASTGSLSARERTRRCAWGRLLGSDTSAEEDYHPRP